MTILDLFTISQDTAHDPDDPVHDTNGNDQGLTSDEDTYRPKWVGYLIARVYHGRRVRFLIPRTIENAMRDPLPGLYAVAGTIDQLPRDLTFFDEHTIYQNDYLEETASIRLYRATGTITCNVPRCPDDWSYDVTAIVISTSDSNT